MKKLVILSFFLSLLFSIFLLPYQISYTASEFVYNNFQRPLTGFIADLCIFKEIYGKECLDSTCHINLSILKQKIAKGLPDFLQAQINEDLSHFKNIKQSELDRFFKEYGKTNFLLRFKVRNKEVEIMSRMISSKNFKIKPGEMSSEMNDISEKSKETVVKYHYLTHDEERKCKIIYYVIKYLAKNDLIQDTDFILAINDYVVNPINYSENEPSGPIFTFAKDLDAPGEKNMILIPDWQNLTSRKSLHQKVLAGRIEYPWHDKISKLFWRGGYFDSTGFRKKLVDYATLNSALIDAKFVSDDKKYYVAEKDQLKYKYLMNIDGLRCAWERLIWQLESNSLVFKHKSSQVQWFYKGLEPFKHYIPLENEDKLAERMAWAESHPEEVQGIIQNAQHFVENNLSLEDFYHYYIVLFQEYNKKLRLETSKQEKDNVAIQ